MKPNTPPAIPSAIGAATVPLFFMYTMEISVVGMTAFAPLTRPFGSHFFTSTAISSRLDKTSAEQDARDRARILAAELARQWGQSINKRLGEHIPGRLIPINPALPEMGVRSAWPTQKVLQGLVVSGQILFPIDYPRWPSPPAWPAQLTPGQLQLWQNAEEALFQKQDPAAARNAISAMQAAGLPEAAAANAQFSLLLLESRKGGIPNLAQRFTDLAHRYPKVCTEAGTPLADLALMQALCHMPSGPLSDLGAELMGRVKSYPSFLTSDLLAAAKRVEADPDTDNSWLADEETRSLLHSFLQHPMESTRSGEIWFQAYFSTVIHVILIPAQVLEEMFLSARDAGRGQVPFYAAVMIQIGDRRWSVTDTGAPVEDLNKPPGELLASASGKLGMTWKMGLPVVAFRDNLLRLAPQAMKEFPGWKSKGDINDILPLPLGTSHPFTVSLTLAHPDLLYARYRQRLWLAAGLILTATAAAGIGLVSAWQAVRRQLRLAEMTSNFVSSVSHELRAPLASVRLMAESLDQGRVADHERQKGYFRLIVQECRRLSSLVENVLDFSRIHQGRKRYEFEPIDLPALLRQTVALMELGAAERQVSLALAELPQGSEDLQPCWDGQAVQQALVNLIDNAIKHSHAGAAVKVGLDVLESAMIRLWVEDQGEGIPAGEQERIFEPFYRRGSELRRETKGIGIGLSIVQSVAEAHGGQVLVQSGVGQGSRFTIELPLRRIGDKHQLDGV